MSRRARLEHDPEGLKEQALRNPGVRAEYEALEPEFVFWEMLRARLAAGLTQAEVAERMGTKAPAVTRLESSPSGKHSPSIATLRRYAEAVGYDLEIHLAPKQPDERSRPRQNMRD